MNNRIKLLERQCWDNQSNCVDTEKFAELIVEDCVSQIAMIGISNFDCEDVVWTVERVIEVIQERYGVTNED